MIYYIICTIAITDDTAPNGDGASVIAMVHLQTPYSYGTRLLRVKTGPESHSPKECGFTFPNLAKSRNSEISV